MKKIGIIVGCIVLCIGCFIGYLFYDTMRSSEQIVLRAIHFEDIEDHVYEGSCEAGIVKARVQAKVENHRLTQVEILQHEQGLGTKAEEIFDEMIKYNTSDVDVVSGATVSSRVLRCALESALP